MRQRQLESLIQRAVALVMASPVASIGCGSGVPPGIEGDPGFVSLPCQNPNEAILKGLTPEPPVDYLELRQTPGPFVGSAPMPMDVAVARVGSACQGVADPTLCSETLALATSKGSVKLNQCIDACSFYYLVDTRGDVIEVLDTAATITAMLGKIDTPQEAMLLVAMKGYELPCQRGGAKPSGDGFDVQAFTTEGCDGRTRHLFHVGASGQVSEISAVVEAEPSNCVVGRRPQGLARARARVVGFPVAHYLSNAARLEAASVHAFRRLARELALHRAPHRLIAAARCAAQDEVRHARVTFELARRFGAQRFEAPQVERLGPRNLETIAEENAVEGCVRETFGAAVGTWQARHAKDPEVQRTMHRIAKDETRHAALAWEVARWSERKLGTIARRRIRRAGREAVATLRDVLRAHIDPSVTSVLGLPSPKDALRLHAELDRTMWG